MVISDEQLAEFQRLYKNRYGKEISKEQAYEQGMKLICMLKCIYKPMTKESFEAIHKRRIETLPGIIAQIASQDSDNIIE